MKLSTICETKSGFTARSRLDAIADGGTRAVQLRDLSGEGDFDPASAPRYQLASSFERYWAVAGDVLFRSRGERSTAVCVAPDTEARAVAILPLIILRPDANRLDGRYLAWFINQPEAQRHFDKCARGTSLRMIPKGCLEDLDVPIPDLNTQRLVVEIDRLAQRESSLMARLSEKKQEFTSFALLEQVRKAQLHGNGAGRLGAQRIRTPVGKPERTE